MKFREVIQWEHTTVEKRGEEYRRFKQQKAEELIDLVESRFPGFRSSIDSYYAATPLTYRDYTGIPEGSMYGILKDCNNPKKSYISAITRIPNLFLSGQNAGGGMHGVLGVTVSALFTCAQFMPVEDLLKKIRDE
jgi:all-trans-retinol 13,14-reductase